MSKAWQVIVQDPDFLSGPSVARSIRTLADCVAAQIVVVDEVEGRGPIRSQLVLPHLLILDVTRAAELAEPMLQFEWGDFYFVASDVVAEQFRDGESCDARAEKALASLRCVDNTYFYIYGADATVLQRVEIEFAVAERKYGAFCELEYPQ